MELFIYIYLVCSVVWAIVFYSWFYYSKYKFNLTIKISLLKLIFNSLFWPITVFGMLIKNLMKHLAK